MMNRNSLGIALIAAVFGTLVGAGCSSSHDNNETCGPTTCAAGTYCCNESCGICVAPGEGCIDLHCAPADAGPIGDAGPGEVCGDDVCGVGTRCCPGCSGGSADGHCAPVHQSCGLLTCDGGPAPRPCGGFAGLTCTPDEYCDYPEEAMCGAADGQGVCRPRPTTCTDDCPGVCGCDGITHCNPCSANAAGASVLHDGACETDAPCAPMNARGEGACRQLIGYIWTGVSCQAISGCECVGIDCHEVFTDEAACQSAYASCD